MLKLEVSRINNYPTIGIIINSFFNYLDLKQSNNVPNFHNETLGLICFNTQIDIVQNDFSLTRILDAYNSILDFMCVVSHLAETPLY